MNSEGKFYIPFQIYLNNYKTKLHIWAHIFVTLTRYINFSTIFFRNTKLLDFSLFKDIRFLNVSTGLSLSFSSDVAFYTMLPVLLSSTGFNVEAQATMTTVFYVCDCISRLIFAISCLFFTVRNRYLFLGGTMCSAIFRVGKNKYINKICFNNSNINRVW